MISIVRMTGGGTMTVAPQGLLNARSVLIRYLGLSPNAVGIVGSTPGGYHNGSDKTPSSDYSVRESTRDRAGYSLDASAMDIGQFRVTANGTQWTLLDFNRWLVAECARNAQDTLDIREVIYTVDGRTVKRWDRLSIRSTGDSSHLTHTHISEFRDAKGRKMVALMNRWLVHIGLLAGGSMDRDLRHGDSGSDVWVLQAALNEILQSMGQSTIALDYSYGNATADAIKRVGIAGGDTTGRTYGPGERYSLQRKLREAAAARAVASVPSGPRGEPGPPGAPGTPGIAPGSRFTMVVEDIDTE